MWVIDMVENVKIPSVEEYKHILIPVPLKMFNDEQIAEFKKTKGKGIFIATSTINNELIEELWTFYKFEEGINFKNYNKDSRILCLPADVDKNKNLINVLYKHESTIHIEYKSLEDAKIHINLDDENNFNEFKVVHSTIPDNINLKIGLYLQTQSYKNFIEFEKTVDLIHDEDFDVLVFPEFCYTPFTIKFRYKNIFDTEDQQEIIEECLELSKSINKAVIVSSEDKNSIIFSVYANANASDSETKSRFYIKHTMTDNSPLIDENYEKSIETLFTPIKYKDYSIGLTICYDCNHAPFSRMYGLQNVDVIINSTGGDVVYDKWYKYNKARAIENQCYNFVTMGGWNENKNKNKNITYGFNPNGGLIFPSNIENEEKPSTCGKVYIYDLSQCSLESKAERSINQPQTVSKRIDYEIPVGNTDEILKESKKIKENLYVHKVGKFNVIFCIVNGNDILKPEKVLPLIYDPSLKELDHRKYIIINRHDIIDEKFFTNYLSIVLKVRSMENFCALILESQNINRCYQASMTRSAQVVQPVNNEYGIDLNRTGGPDAIWTNKNGMRKNWRKNFEKLIEFMANETK